MTTLSTFDDEIVELISDEDDLEKDIIHASEVRLEIQSALNHIDQVLRPVGDQRECGGQGPCVTRGVVHENAET